MSTKLHLDRIFLFLYGFFFFQVGNVGAFECFRGYLDEIESEKKTASNLFIYFFFFAFAMVSGVALPIFKS